MAGTPIVTRPEVGQDAVAGTTQQQNSVSLQANCIYNCEIISIDVLQRTVTVAVGESTIVRDCIPMAMALSPLLGMENTSMPGIGTHGILFHTATSNYFLGAIKDTTPLRKVFSGRAAGAIDEDEEVLAKQQKAYQTARLTDQAPTKSGFAEAGDMLPGEAESSNGMGVAVRLLQNFQQLSAGGLAKIEAHLVNDMIRLVDNYYVHHTCGSDRMIWSNGHVNDEEHLTSYQFEADGKKVPEEKLYMDALSAWDPARESQRRTDMSITSAVGRWRLSHYKGFLGDMIHTWVTCPTEVYSGFMDGAIRAGQFRSWVGADGTYMLQAAGGVHLRVARTLIIPEIKKAWNDPEVDQQKLFESLDDTYLAIWGKGPQWKDLLTAVWQMRYYWRYLVDFHSLARFHQLEKADSNLCHVPSEAECDTDNRRNSVYADETDKKGATGGGAHKGEATVDLYPDGSLQMQSMNTASVTLNQGNVQIAAAGNIELKAGHTVSIQGKFVVAQSVLDMDIHSIYGRLTLKARTAWNALCERGRMWLKSCAKWCGQEGNVGSSRTGDFGSITGDAQNPPELNKYSIFLDAAEGGMLAFSKYDQVQRSRQGDLAMETNKGKVELMTRSGQIQLIHDGEEGYEVQDDADTEPPGSGEPETDDKGGLETPPFEEDDAIPAEHEYGGILIRSKGGIGIHTEKELSAHYEKSFKLGDKFLLDENNNLYFEGNMQVKGSGCWSATMYADRFEARSAVRTYGMFTSKQSPMVMHDKELKFPDLTMFVEHREEKEEFTTEHEDCDNLWKEAKKLEWDKDRLYTRPEFMLTFSYWQFRDWKPCSPDATYWRSYKAALYEDAVENGGYEDAQWVQCRPHTITLLGGERVSEEVTHWPGKNGATIAVCSGHKFQVLNKYGPEFAKGDINPGMSDESYFWYVLRDYGKLLHSWNSLPGTHGCSNKTK